MRSIRFIKSNEMLKIVIKQRTSRPKTTGDGLMVSYNELNHKLNVTVPYYWGDNWQDKMDEIQKFIDEFLVKYKIPVNRVPVSEKPVVSTKNEIEGMAISQMGNFNLPLSLLSGFVWKKKKSTAFASVSARSPHVMTINEVLLSAPKEVANMTMAHEVCHIYMIHTHGFYRYEKMGYHGYQFWKTLSDYTGISVSKLQSSSNDWLKEFLRS